MHLAYWTIILLLKPYMTLSYIAFTKDNFVPMHVREMSSVPLTLTILYFFDNIIVDNFKYDLILYCTHAI
jgi:hypothetical protein